MGLLDKIKNALFEEDEEEPKEEQHEIAKKIDIAKTIDEDKTSRKREPNIEENFSLEHEKIEKPSGPVIFDVEDFVEDTKPSTIAPERSKKPEKILYGGYESNYKEPERSKEKFKPSPVISPVYGILDKNYTAEEQNDNERKPLDHLFVEERKKKIDLDTIRQKAYGDVPIIEEPKKEESGLLYEMQDNEDRPEIGKITLGDAEEYFDDLGLEYNVDYTDLAKKNKTRSQKNKELTDVVNEEIKGQEAIKKDIKQKSEVKKVCEPEDTKSDEPEDKSLYDLIDMMYDNKE